MTIAFIDANGDGYPSKESLRAFPDVSKVIEGNKAARRALPVSTD